jgi:large subunit ribosomal protein L28
MKMAKICEICGKCSTSGVKYKRRGLIKRKGGAGSKIVGKTLRRFLPNLQKIKITLKGTVKRTNVCTSCIQGNKIVKA